MRGHCILSHGFESGPDATKVTALAQAAAELGWTCERPDYTDLDACADISPLGDVPQRLQRLVELTRAAAARGPVVLAGSSLGAFISAHASMQVPVAGLFLMAPPIRMNQAHPIDAADVPLSILHGWDDELIPAADVVGWAQERRARLLLVDDDHRLSRHVQASADAFMGLLSSLQPSNERGDAQ
ncbi:alpha/beta fold hydrolase [Lysobacter sp. H23M47]|uniref:alpha/beta fold hydrolase n=1 Tax=Lysobacter sp. H23M47 TaxID=2781024 RepID=UPI0018806871|nr:alpha/beta fold hydrolase [Lysobacter sp. H23M47]QOW23974.1 alpha/beta fold hydrolase [Lysobacter sp. H23M47]